MSGSEDGVVVAAAAKTRDSRSRTISEAVTHIFRPSSREVEPAEAQASPQQPQRTASGAQEDEFDEPSGFGDFLAGEQSPKNDKKVFPRLRQTPRQRPAEATASRRMSPYRKSNGSSSDPAINVFRQKQIGKTCLVL